MRLFDFFFGSIRRAIGGAFSPWGKRVAAAGCVIVMFFLGFMIPYLMYLNHQVLARFGELRWQIPTRVYARPFVLRPMQSLDEATLLTELAAAGYHEDQFGEVRGTYARSAGHWTISSRGFVDVAGPVPPLRIAVQFGANQLVTLRAYDGKQSLSRVRLDPARIATLYGQKQEERRLVRLDEVPDLLVTGLQAVEDRRFDAHVGIDPSGMIRALWFYIRSGGDVRQGASTLTQQLARSGLLGIGKEQTFWRKFNEIFYALLIESHYDKRTILETYLNQVYLGQRGLQEIHGVSSAASFWFGRDLDALTDADIALLIGLVKGPSYYDPRHNPQRALARRQFVLTRLHDNGLLNDARFQRALLQPLGVLAVPDLVAANRFPAYIDLVRRQLEHDYPEETLHGAGMTVLTGMSPSAQAYAESAVMHTVDALEHTTPRKFKRSPLESSVVLTDTHNGDVLAVVGGRHPTDAGFDRSLDAKRSVGSLLKPFVYLLELASPNQWSLASWIDDTPITVPLARGHAWMPSNADGQSHGSVRLLDALTHSYNQATVRLGLQVTPERLVQLLRVLAGIEAEPNPALLLGGTDQSPYAMAQLYQFLASGGQVQPLHAVRGVLGPHGRLLSRYDKTPPPAQPGDSVAANLINIALQRVITEGTAQRLLTNGLGSLTAAGKTGTSNDGRDSWFAGYTGDFLAVVWMGNDRNEQTGLYGATGAMRVWSVLFKRLPSAPLVVNEKGIDWQWVSNTRFNTTQPQCANSRQFPFVVGFAPPYIPCAELEQDATKKPWSWRHFFHLDRQPPAAAPAPSYP